MVDSPHAFQLIRSFVRREKKLKQPIHSHPLWSTYGINALDSFINFQHYFKKDAPITLEIGFGKGHTLFAQASHNLDINYIGIEVYQSGIHSLLAQLSNYPLSNIRIIEGDAVEKLNQCIPNYSLQTIQILFPDPWPKYKHHKRRLIQPNFIALLHKKLRPGGTLYLATDWENYAIHMLHTLQLSSTYFINCSKIGHFSERLNIMPYTKFEQRGLNFGHKLWYLYFKATP